MSNGQSIPDDAPLDDEIESEEVLRRLIEYDEALGAGLTDSLDDDETFQRLNPDVRRQVGEIGEMLELLNIARNSPDARFVRAIGPAVESTDILTDEKSDFRRIGRFQIVRELGRGGYGIVFLAVDPQLGRKVAVKVPRPETLISKTAKRRFIAEGQLAAALNHPGVQKVYEAGEAGPVSYIASEYCAGPSLQQWLVDHGSTVTPPIAARILAELADAVEHAHQRGILHRDLKPANVLLQPMSEHTDCIDGMGEPAPICTDAAAGEFPFTVKLSDFGIAKVFEETDDRTQTMTGTILGTAPYMSPEQASGKNSLIGPPSDIYGLGAILYELLSGKPPFDGESRAAVIQRVLTGEPVRPRSVRKEVPVDLEAICLKCLEKDPGRRYLTAAELRDDLGRFLAGKPVSARPLTATRRLVRWSRRKPASAAFVLLACLSLLGFAAGGWWHSLRLQSGIESTERERQRADDRGRESELQRAAAEDSEKRLRRDVFCLDANAAYRAVTGGRPDHALELLHPYESDPSVTSSFAWRYLWRLCHMAERVWSEPELECNSVHFSPDGTRLAAGIENGTAPIWDVSTGKEVLRLRGHTSCVNTVYFTPDGARLVTASCDGTVRLWDARTGSELRVLLKQKSAVTSLALNLDGTLAASGDDAGTISIFHLPGGEKLAAASIGGRRIDDLAFSADSKLLAAACWDDLYVGDVYASAGLVKVTQVSEPGFQQHAARFSPSRSILAWAGTTGTVHLRDLVNPQNESSIQSSNSVRTLSFDRRGGRLLCAGDSQIVELWDVATRKQIAEFVGHTNRITSVALSPDERRAASAGFDGTVRLWSLEKSVESMVVPHATGADKMAFAAHGSLLVIGGGGKVRAFDTSRWREEFSDDADRIAVSVGPAGDFLAMCRNRVGVVRNIKTRKECGSFNLGRDNSTILDLALSGDGRHVVAVGGLKVHHWDLRSPASPTAFGSIPAFGSMSMSPRGGCVVLSNAARVFDAFQYDYDVNPHAYAHGSLGVVRQVCYNGDGSLFAGASADASVYVWEAQTSKLIASLIGHEAPANCVAFSPDGITLASGDDGGIVRLWDLQSRHEALRIKAHTQAVKSLAFSPDGTLLATATAHAPEKSGEVRIWFAAVPAN